MNAYSALGVPITASDTSCSHSGNSALKLKSVMGQIPGEPMQLMSGIALVGSIDGGGNETVGWSYTGRPDSLTAWYKYLPNGNDNFVVVSVLSKWNVSLMKKDTVAIAYFTGNATSNYSKLSVPFSYQSPIAPDTASVFISNTNATSASQVGTVLIIDDVDFVKNLTGLCENNRRTGLKVFPNPASCFLSIETEANGLLYIFDSLGNLVESMNTNAVSTTIDVTKYASGVYFIKNMSGEYKRFVVTHID